MGLRRLRGMSEGGGRTPEAARVATRGANLHCFDELVLRNFSLPQYSCQRADFDFAMHRYYAALGAAPHDDVASGLADFDKPQAL